MQCSRGDPRQLRQGGHVNVGPGKEEHVHANLRPREFHGGILVPVCGRPQELDLVGRAHDGHVLAGGQRPIAERGQHALEDAHLAADVLGDSEGRLERGAKARVLRGIPLEHGGEILEEDVHDLPALLKVDEEVVGCRHEQLDKVSDNEHLRTRESTLEAVVVHAVVVREESHLRPGRAGERVQRVSDGLGHAPEHAAPDASGGDVNDEEVGGRLGGAYHVLAGGDVLDNALRQLGAGLPIATPTVLVQVAEVGGRDLVEL
mmetsp:Transcript_24139/g.51695  ORF Transcript_24139/g.51695 Transcript_24139/m.51695 type:complete len:261 (-) Transcript_24139:1365-2147(-)